MEQIRHKTQQQNQQQNKTNKNETNKAKINAIKKIKQQIDTTNNSMEQIEESGN